jgi:hypothetical protein
MGNLHQSAGCRYGNGTMVGDPMNYRESADALAERLRIRKALSQDMYVNRQDAIKTEECWTPADQAALNGWDAMKNNAPVTFREVANKVCYRLRLWAEMQKDAREMGDEYLDLKPEEVWECYDEMALHEYEQAAAKADGLQSLFKEIAQ